MISVGLTKLISWSIIAIQSFLCLATLIISAASSVSTIGFSEDTSEFNLTEGYPPVVINPKYGNKLLSDKVSHLLYLSSFLWL